MAHSLLPPISPFTKDRLPMDSVTIPMTFPLLGNRRWRASYNEDWGTHRHTGCDLPAPKLTPIVAPFSGTLGFKPQTFWIVREDAWGCLGTHLNDDTPSTADNKANPDFMFAPSLYSGDRVVEGQLIGYVGDSGLADGPHLHFELHGPEGLRDPAPSLRVAHHRTQPILLPYEAPPPPALGLTRVDACLRGYDPQRRQLTVLPVLEPGTTGPLQVVTRPRYQSFVLEKGVVYPSVPAHTVVTLYHRRGIVQALMLPPNLSRPPLPVTAQALTTPVSPRLTRDALLTQCAQAELTHFSKLDTPRWVRTGSMALGPLRVRGVRLKQAAILCLRGAPLAPQNQALIQEAARYDGFTRFGGAVGLGRTTLVFADG